MDELLNNLLSDIFRELREIIFSEETRVRSRLKPKYSTRDRKVPFPYLVIFIMANLAGSLDYALNKFHTDISVKAELITEPAFSKARNHMDDYPFRLMFKKVRDLFLDFQDKYLNKDSCLLFCSVDGSLQSLPNIPKLKTFFGTSGRGSSSPTARMSLVYGSRYHFIYDAMIAPVSSDERELALASLKRLKEFMDLSKIVFIFDRGYAGVEFFKKLKRMGTHFIIRVRSKFHGLENLEPEAGYVVHFCEDFTARAIKLKLDSQTVETLVTDLSGFPPFLFKDLYHLRWPVEIAFYFIKHVLRLGDFNGYTIGSIYQDFWVAMTLSNIASIVKMAADLKIQKTARKTNRYEYEANLSEIISELHTWIIKILLEKDDYKRKRYIYDLIDKVSHYRTPIRKYRQCERRLSRKAEYHFNQKVH